MCDDIKVQKLYDRHMKRIDSIIENIRPEKKTIIKDFIYGLAVSEVKAYEMALSLGYDAGFEAGEEYDRLKRKLDQMLIRAERRRKRIEVDTIVNNE